MIYLESIANIQEGWTKKKIDIEHPKILVTSAPEKFPSKTHNSDKRKENNAEDRQPQSLVIQHSKKADSESNTGKKTSTETLTWVREKKTLGK